LARACLTCNHPDREAIDKALVGGVNNRDISQRYGLHKDALARHAQGHLSPALVKAHAKREDRRAASLLDRIEELYEEARAVLEDAKADRKGAISINAIREMRSTLELIGRLTGELRDAPGGTVVNVIASPDWLVVREAMFEVLARHPAVQAEVATRLDALAIEAPERAQEGA
jgi:hypothetical protein